jgi:tRNA (pseudouridine54-N1)-methyltransferase
LDERSWEYVLRDVLSGKTHPGVQAERGSLQRLVQTKAEKKIPIYVLEEKGKNIRELDFDESAMFVLGDHIGLPKKDEKFVLRYGEKISLGKQRYLAASCIDIINYVLDEHILKKYNYKR